MKLFSLPFAVKLAAFSAISAGTAHSAIILDDGSPFNLEFTTPAVYPVAAFFQTNVSTFTIVFEDVFATAFEANDPNETTGANGFQGSLSDTIAIQKNSETPISPISVSYIAGGINGPTRDLQLDLELDINQLASIISGDTITITGGASFASLPALTSLGETVNTGLVSRSFFGPPFGTLTLDVVPEPSSALLIVSAMGFGLLRRRRS